MAARAYTEYSQPDLRNRSGSSIHGSAFKTETLAIGGITVVSAAALTEAEWAKKDTVVRIITDDTACFVAVGVTPDPDALVATIATSSRRFIPVGGSIDLLIQPGQKVGVKQVT